MPKYVTEFSEPEVRVHLSQRLDKTVRMVAETQDGVQQEIAAFNGGILVVQRLDPARAKELGLEVTDEGYIKIEWAA